VGTTTASVEALCAAGASVEQLGTTADSPQIDHVAAPGVGRLHFRGRKTAEGSTSPGVGPKAPLPARPALTRWKEADKQVN
jgi:hypothetical protein